MLFKQLEWTPEFRAFQEYGLTLINPKEVDRISKAQNDNHIIQKRFYRVNIPKWISDYFHPLMPEIIQIFSAKPDSIGKYHKDGLNRRAALNIPLFACDQGVVEWTSEELELWSVKSPYTLIRLNAAERGTGTERPSHPIQESLLLTQPTVLNVDHWHRVNNSGNLNYRFVMSFRFLGNPNFEILSSALERICRV